MEEYRILLVTGSPRSGTTAVGQMLSAGQGICALHEPFNRHVGIVQVDRYFMVPGIDELPKESFDTLVGRIRRLDLKYKPGVFPGDRGVRRFLKRILGGRAVNSYRRCRFARSLECIVWKDPFACFCAERLTAEHDVQVVVAVRNPWAVAGSFKRLGWSFDIQDLTARLRRAGLIDLQELSVVREGLDEEELEDPVTSAAVLWPMIYGTLARWSRERGEIYLLDLDAIVEDPVTTYQSVYRRLRLPWSERVEKRIRQKYRNRSRRRVPRKATAHDSRRDLRAINRYWTELLTKDEVRTVDQRAGQAWARVQEAMAE